MLNAKITHLEWDSNFFKKKVYKLELTDFVSDIDIYLDYFFAQTKADIIYVFSNEEFNKSKQYEFLCVDNKVVFEKNINDSNIENCTEIVPVFEVTEQLIKLGLLSGQHSRFKTDLHLTHKFNQLYTLWLTKSLNREIASETLAYISNELELGFITIKKINEQGIIGLVSVSENAHGQGIGSKLLKAAEKWCMQNGVNKLEVATQMANVRACGFYKKNNYSIKQSQFIYHAYNKK